FGSRAEVDVDVGERRDGDREHQQDQFGATALAGRGRHRLDGGDGHEPPCGHTSPGYPGSVLPVWVLPVWVLPVWVLPSAAPSPGVGLGVGPGRLGCSAHASSRSDCTIAWASSTSSAAMESLSWFCRMGGRASTGRPSAIAYSSEGSTGPSCWFSPR